METCLRGTSLLSVILLNSNWKCNFLSRMALPDHKCAFRRRRTATLLENKKMNKPAYWCGSPPVCSSHRERKPNPITPRAMTDTAWHVWGLDLALGTHLRIVPKKEKEGLGAGGLHLDLSLDTAVSMNKGWRWKEKMALVSTSCGVVTRARFSE